MACRTDEDDELDEAMLNRVEAVIRCYDPCLSCSTHAVGQMPLPCGFAGTLGDADLAGRLAVCPSCGTVSSHEHAAGGVHLLAVHSGP